MRRMTKIRFATIGTNFIVSQFRQAARLCERFELTAVYSRSRETGSAFAGDARIRVYDDLTELARDPAVDAVYIASPTCCHAAQAIQMLKAGKHVLCEKPAASNQAEWEAMRAAAAASGKVLLEAMRPLFTPGFQMVQELLPKIGKIRMADFTFCKYSSRYDAFKAGKIENAFRPELSNGALMDIGIYPIASMLGLFGKPLSVSGSAYILKDSIDGCGTIQARYPEAIVTLRYSKITDSAAGCEIQGEAGILSYPQVEAPGRITIRYRSGETEEFGETVITDDMLYELEAFIDMIAGRQQADSFQHLTGEALAITDEIRERNGITFLKS